MKGFKIGIKCLFCPNKAVTYVLDGDAHVFMCNKCYENYKNKKTHN